MVTLPVARRLPHVRNAVAAYDRQTHPRKELLVIVNGGDEDGRRGLVDYLASLGREDVRTVEIPGKLSLGLLRNLSFDHARGDYVCQWDDDDLYHPERLARQVAPLVEQDLEASYLQEVMQYVPKAGSIYWTNWAATDAQTHPGTLMARRDTPVRYDVEGEFSQFSEDLKVALDLGRRGRVCHIAGQPHLFLYVNHGANSWHEGHFTMLTERLAISRGLLARREAEIREGLRPFHFEVDPLRVWGNNGLAFEIHAGG